jgi:hypothetical protein
VNLGGKLWNLNKAIVYAKILRKKNTVLWLKSNSSEQVDLDGFYRA